MIASSSTFHPHPGRVIRDLFHLLNAVRHCKEALVCTAIIQGKLQPPRIWPVSSGSMPVAYPGSSAQQRSECSTSISAGTGVGRGRVFAIRSLTGMNGVTLPIVTLGTILPEDSGAVRNATEFQH